MDKTSDLAVLAHVHKLKDPKTITHYLLFKTYAAFQNKEQELKALVDEYRRKNGGVPEELLEICLVDTVEITGEVLKILSAFKEDALPMGRENLRKYQKAGLIKWVR